jgi:two-component system NtrC family sensor kinase
MWLFLPAQEGGSMIQKLLLRLVSLRLQRVLVVGFVLTTAITILISTPITYRVINGYLAGAQDDRVGRDMNLAEAFYVLKLNDIDSTALRLASEPGVQNNLSSASRGDVDALLALEEEMHNELSVLPPSTRRFVVTVDAQGKAVAGRICCKDEQLRLAVPNADWSGLPIVKDVLTKGQPQAATEVIPADILNWVYLDEQARIALEETPKAAPQPFDPREGTAGLTVMGVAPVKSSAGDVIGAILVGHLINNDFTLVDRIKEVAGVDTATIFFGDLRVSTNVLKENGQRAIGTRVSQEVYDRVLLQGQEFTGPAYVVNQWYISRYRPLKDHLGQIVGILYVGAKQSTFQGLVDSFGRQVFLIAGASILLSALIAIPVARSISRPLSDLAQATHQVAEGNWSARVPVYGRGEMGTLAESFNTMVETLQDTNDQLVQKEKLASVGQLAAGVAHEINNPLGSVLLYADILCRETPPDNTQQREDLAMIIKEATRCKTIVTDLLNFSRQNEVLAQKTDLTTLLQELAEEASKKQLYAKVKLTTELDPSLPLIEADPLQLRQAFLNLMNNGAEAMSEGGELTLRARRGPNAGFVTVEVQDTGTGISDENMKKLFTPFFTTKPIGKGTGLGLAITYGIVKMHQGQINVQSQVGKGTTFTITLREMLPDQEKSAVVGK